MTIQGLAERKDSADIVLWPIRFAAAGIDLTASVNATELPLGFDDRGARPPNDHPAVRQRFTFFEYVAIPLFEFSIALVVRSLL